MLNKSGESRHPCIVPELKSKAFAKKLADSLMMVLFYVTSSFSLAASIYSLYFLIS